MIGWRPAALSASTALSGFRLSPLSRARLCRQVRHVATIRRFAQFRPGSSQMKIRSALIPSAMASAMAAWPALAAPESLANGKSFQLGQSACLKVAGKDHLARCEMVLNNTSWTKVEDTCPENGVPPHSGTEPISDAPRTSPSGQPSEPVEN
jgi:hypothetical protein